MEIIPSIANYFGVTIDELFGYHSDREKRINEFVDRLTGINAINKDNVDNCILLARNALVEFPTNEKLLLCLASILHTAGHVKYQEYHLTDHEGYDRYHVEQHRTYVEWSEAIAIYEKVLPVLADGPARHEAVKQLAYLYLCVGEHEKADKLSENAPDIYSCREFLKFSTCDGKERSAKYAETALKLLGITAELIGDAVAINYNTFTSQEAEDYIKNAANIFDVICPDGEYGEYRTHAAYLYLYLSTHQWRNGKYDAAFESLYKALEHTKKCERFSLNPDITFDSALLKNVKINPKGNDFNELSRKLPAGWPWICIPNSEDVAIEMQSDPRWQEWVTKAQS